ncbi:hypothetical protein [Polaromonas sp. CF318]|uniref:hypothetical protein n=1 Tax=Polaromonas sp. CF318 TaxID=1144318 RepID=UPI0005624926|nr:hypothetical protein [Polaromonas sp. CF318]
MDCLHLSFSKAFSRTGAVLESWFSPPLIGRVFARQDQFEIPAHIHNPRLFIQAKNMYQRLEAEVRRQRFREEFIRR